MNSLAFLSFAMVLGQAPPVWQEMPVATFTVENGWLNIEVLYLGLPVEDVKIVCTVGATQYASGESNEIGFASFPVPNAEYFQIVFDLGSGPSAPIPITMLKNGTAIPTSSPIRDGTASCCRVKPGEVEFEPAPPTAAEPVPSFWQRNELPIGLGVGTLGCILVVLGWRLRR